MPSIPNTCVLSEGGERVRRLGDGGGRGQGGDGEGRELDRGQKRRGERPGDVTQRDVIYRVPACSQQAQASGLVGSLKQAAVRPDQGVPSPAVRSRGGSFTQVTDLPRQSE